MIVQVLEPFWVFFGSFLKVFARFLGFENIVGGAQSVVNGIFFYDFHETARIKSV